MPIKLIRIGGTVVCMLDFKSFNPRHEKEAFGIAVGKSGSWIIKAGSFTGETLITTVIFKSNTFSGLYDDKHLFSETCHIAHSAQWGHDDYAKAEAYEIECSLLIDGLSAKKTNGKPKRL